MLFLLPVLQINGEAQTVNPMMKRTWIIGFGGGPGTPYFGNGLGFGPGFKVFFETGMWELGPGTLTIGGETGFSMFWHHWGTDWNESWANFLVGGRSAYHYGWEVKGLDTYGGIPLGIGFSVHSFDDVAGYKGFTPVYPYFGIFFGATYFFNDLIGVNGEVGYNITYANLGLVFQLP